MIRIREVKVERYDPKRYGLLKSRRRLVRVRFETNNWRSRWIRRYANEKQLRVLLPDVYEAIGKSPLAPLVMPERIRADWSEDEQAFVLRAGSAQGEAISGFEVSVNVEVTDDDATDDTAELAESAVATLHGAPLPGLGR